MKAWGVGARGEGLGGRGGACGHGGLRLRLLAVVVTVLSGQEARAGEIRSSEDGEWVWEAGGYVKSQSLGMHFRDISLYDYVGPEESAGMHTARARVDTALMRGDLEAAAAYEFRFVAVTSALDGQSTLPGFGSTQTRPRLWDIEPDRGDGVTLEHDIDRANLFFPLGPADVRLGRQAISWGSAWFWKPTDRFSPFSPADIDPDVKRGVDAARAEWFLGPRTSFDLVATFERHPGTDRELWAGGGVRFRTGIGVYDLAVSAARFQLTSDSNYMAGAEFTGELGKVGFRGEAALNYLVDAEKMDLEAVLGIDYRFGIGLMTACELFYNGFGATDPAGYSGYFFGPGADAERLARGEAFNVGRYYAGIMANQEVTPLLHVSVSAIGNAGDPSALLIAGLDWSIVENGRFKAGAMVPVGEKPAGPTLKSEFGALPVLGFGVLKLTW